MALNFTVSYTFSPSTTISSSQVNTNTSDVAAVFQGLESETKSFAKLKVDIDPTLALEVATKQYVDHYSTWRRPVLQWGSATTVAVEAGLDGTSGDIPILFPDGTIRTETSTTRTTFNITRNAVLTTSGAQSGLRTSLSEATNTWYGLYAVKVTDSSTLWCTVGDTVIPTQGTYASLNSNYGTSGWVYLGMIRNGDNSGSTGDILQFYQAGNTTQFVNACTGQGINLIGTLLTTTAGATSLTYTYSAGIGTNQIPSHIPMIYLMEHAGSGGTGTLQFGNAAVIPFFLSQENTSTRQKCAFWSVANQGAQITAVASRVMDISLMGFIDGVLGVGSNPIL